MLQAVVLKGPEGLTPYLQVPNNIPPREVPVKYPERPRTDTRLQWYGKQTDSDSDSSEGDLCVSQ